MTEVKYSGPSGVYFKPLADGKFHQEVTEDTPGATYREYETSDGNKGGKWELKAKAITGVVESISIYEGDYGKNIQVRFEGEEGEDPSKQVVVSLPAGSQFGEKFLHRAPHIKKGEKVTISAYASETPAGKKNLGVAVIKDEEPVQSAYSVYNKDKEKFEYIDKKFPQPEGDTSKYDKDDWKMYFTKARKYMLEKLKEHELYSDESYEVAPQTPVKSDDAEVIDF